MIQIVRPGDVLNGPLACDCSNWLHFLSTEHMEALNDALLVTRESGPLHVEALPPARERPGLIYYIASAKRTMCSVRESKDRLAQNPRRPKSTLAWTQILIAKRANVQRAKLHTVTDGRHQADTVDLGHLGATDAP